MRLHPRKRLFVDRAVQGTLLFRIAIYWCFSVLAVSLFVLCARALADPGEPFLDYFAFKNIFSQYGIVILASGLLLPLIMLDALVISNRFVGPLFRLRRSMRDLANGQQVNPIEFRENDHWHELAHEFNAISQCVEQLREELAQLKAKANGQTDPEDLEPVFQS